MERTTAEYEVAAVLNLEGVRCPLNWARAKVRLADLSPGEILELVVDEERAVRDIPRAAEAEGHHLVDIRSEGNRWSIIIEC